MEKSSIKAYGKVNLGLDITGRRDDGYHLVKMILQTVDVFDEVTVEMIEKGVLLETDSPKIPCDERNLAYKAAKKIIEMYGLKQGVRIYIKKNIPVAAGMAGGSTDAAAVLKAMNEIFDLNMSTEKMDEIALTLGADVPFCLRKGTYLAEGIGEKLTELPKFSGAHIVIINPKFDVSTAYVYGEYDKLENVSHPDMDALVNAIKAGDAREVSSNMGNVLEEVVIKKYPQLDEIKNSLMELGANGALMSGSGPTVFGLFDDKEMATNAFNTFKEDDYDKFQNQL